MPKEQQGLNTGETQYGNVQELGNLTSPQDYLYFNLCEIAEKAGKATSDLVKKNLAIVYAQVVAELWQDVEVNYNDIDELSKAFAKANAVLAEDDKIKPVFKDIQFDGKSIGDLLPGNFAGCTLENCVFINCDISFWNEEAFENAVINNCVFDDACYCSASNFAKVKSIYNYTFKESFAEFDGAIEHNGIQCIPVEDANEVLITTIVEHAQEKRKLEEENQMLRAQVLKAQLQSLQTGQTSVSSTSGFFDPKRKSLENGEESHITNAKRSKGV